MNAFSSTIIPYLLLGAASISSNSSATFLETEFNESRVYIYAEISLECTGNFKEVDDYVDSQYYIEPAKAYSSPDYPFLSLVQDLSETQVKLDEDLALYLDDLLVRKMNSLPSKKRF